MSLTDVVTAINDQITAAIAPAPPPCFRFGDETLRQQDSPPRIAYVPRSERIGAPTGVGAQGDGVTSPRALFTRHVGIEVHIWERDIPAAEALLDQLVRAMQIALWGAYDLSAGDWTTASESVNKKGVVYVLTMTWRIPITRAPDTYAVVATIPITGQIQQPV